MRKIIHVDMDCFYASVELLDRPEYVGRPLAVGGSPAGRGVLCTANYEARKFGVHSAMSSALAVKKCPQLVIVPPAFSKYTRFSKIVREIFLDYTSQIEPLSLDEAYLDVTDSGRCHGSATLIAKEIRERIFEQTALTASAGVAPNKFLAKIASDWNKPNGLTVVAPHQVEDFVKLLPVGKINGVGKVMEKKLHSLGLETCLDIRQKGENFMQATFGSHGQWLYELAWGRDDRKVGVRSKRKSLSLEHTYSRDVEGLQECQRIASSLLLELRERLLRYESRLEDDGEELPPIKNVVMKIKFNDFSRITRECSIPPRFWDGLKEDAERFRPFYDLIDELTRQAWESRCAPVRLLGLGVKFAIEDEKKELAQTNQLRLL